jgi:mannose-1-phosphate guanylyltransferase/phosphomannomutase
VLLPIFAALNVNIVPLNAQLDDSRVSVRWDERERWLHQLSKIVSVLETDFGVQLDARGEKLLIVTDRGALVPNDIAALMMVELALRANEVRAKPVAYPKIAVPVNQTLRFEELARSHQAGIIRTKVNQYALMQAATHPDVILAADGKGSFIFPGFQPVVDGLIALAKLLEFIALLDTTVSQAVANLPSFSVAHGYVSCGWEKKGQIMRLLNDQFKEMQSQDGLKVFFGEHTWVLIRPDPYQPGFKVSAEALTLPQAEHLVREYQELVKSLED